MSRAVKVIAIICFIIGIGLTIMFITLAKLEYDINSKLYNTTYIKAVGYDTQFQLCNDKPITGVVHGEYYAWNSKHNLSLYKRSFMVSSICGNDTNETLINAQHIWPIGSTRLSNYLISDPYVLESMVPHGELHIMGAMVMGLLSGLVVVFYIIWYKRNKPYTVQYYESVLYTV